MTTVERLSEAIAQGIKKELEPRAPRDLRWSTEEMMGLARSAVAKIDAQGPRGTTLCTMDEIEAMALTLVMTGVLIPAPDPQSVNETPIFTTRRTTP